MRDRHDRHVVLRGQVGRADPERPVQPSGERVPSGKTTTFQPSASRSPGVDDSVPPRRSIGNVLNTIADPVARHQVSKK